MEYIQCTHMTVMTINFGKDSIIVGNKIKFSSEYTCSLYQCYSKGTNTEQTTLLTYIYTYSKLLYATN